MNNKPKFTNKQLASINIRNKNTLVSAAAGSGKTAVLVERIINRILDENDPVDIDRILVMTFTRAAAAQMKERILNAINDKKSLNPHDKNLNKQYSLVHNAYIMTIDSFCMSVVRNHFDEIGLSPDFRMADEGEIKLLKQDVIESVLEEYYELSDEKFLEMTEIFAANKTDYKIEELVLSLFDYAISYPDPLAFLNSCKDEYLVFENVLNADGTIESLYEPKWLTDYADYIKRDLKHCRDMLDKAADLCMHDLGPKPYLPNIEDELVLVDNLLNYDSYEKLYENCSKYADYAFKSLSRVTMPKAGTVSDEEVLQRTELKDLVKSMRDTGKKTVQSVLDSVNSSPMSEVVLGMNRMSAPVLTLIEVVKTFIGEFDARKREKNIVDFNDLEHMCLNILKNSESSTAAEYREFFEEIYVDEYQDSNYVQEEIVKLISKKGDNTGNVFMVGDVKQSIYGFRNAKPEIFVNKYNTFATCPENLLSDMPADIRIDLSDNFRSREEVLFSVNSIFEKIMKRELGGIEYDDDAALHPGKKYVDTGCDYETELMLMVHDEDVLDKEAEALMVAGKIHELMETMLVEDGDGKRPLRYSDIVILLRTTSGWDRVFMDILESQGIPVFTSSSTGYFEAMEIRTILNFLTIIDNPLQDIPLAAVLMSIIGGFSEEDVAIVRGEFKEGCLYDALNAYYANEKYDEQASLLSAKVGKFLGLLDYYRKKSQYMTVVEILTEIIDGEYGRIIKAMPGGTKKYANLNMLIKKATEFAKTSYKGVFQFNRYIESIRKYEIDYGEANISDESDNTVRIMSIHKSKGLEFPVCFVCAMSKKFNMADTKNIVLTDGNYGIATDVIDLDRRIKSKSLFKASVSQKKRLELISEELRLLYVAMTRAKEKLIMTGTVKNDKAVTDSLTTLEKSSSYLDFYVCASEGGEVPNIRSEYYTVSDLTYKNVENTIDNEISRNRLISIIEGKNEDIDLSQIETIKSRLNFKYPHIDKGYVKVSVSELKHRSEKQDDSVEDADVTKYLYIGNDNNIAALHGTAVHRIFELWDYNLNASEESVREFLKYIKEEKLIEEDLLDTVTVDEITAFVKSDIAQRMKKAYENGTLNREQPFVICDDENDPESMLVQGIIDAYFIEDEKIVLVDYKTDRGKNEQKLICDHKTQLDYYAKALSRLLHRDIKESVIYSTVLKKSISI